MSFAFLIDVLAFILIIIAIHLLDINMS